MIYGILVYDAAGDPVFVSEPLGPANAFLSDSSQRVLAGAEMVEVERRIDGDEVYSVLRPIRDPAGRVAGILEVAQPLAFVRAEISRVVRRFLLNTLTLLCVLTALTLWLVRHSISRHLERFLAAIRAVGRGELSHRVSEDPRGGNWNCWRGSSIAWRRSSRWRIPSCCTRPRSGWRWSVVFARASIWRQAATWWRGSHVRRRQGLRDAHG